MIELALQPSFASACGLGLLEVDDLQMGPSPPSLVSEIEQFCDRRRRFFGGGNVAEVPGVKESRTLINRLGADPTKARPCSEMFLRRILRGDAFPRVSNLVDLNNYCSAELAAPVCVYDLQQIEPPVLFREGEDGESFLSIRDASVSVQRRPVLVDKLGPFGGPFVDSKRTMIARATQKALVVWFCPAEYPRYALRADIETFAERLDIYRIGKPGNCKWTLEQNAENSYLPKDSTVTSG